MDVRLDVLDALVLEQFAYRHCDAGMQPEPGVSEALVATAASLQHAFPSVSKEDLDVHSSIGEVSECIRAGDLESAVALINHQEPELLASDPHLAFALKKQQLVEALRRVYATASACQSGVSISSGGGTGGSAAQPGAPAEALRCLRAELAPLALVAYPEAYPELKQTLLLFVYGPPPDCLGQQPQQQQQQQQLTAEKGDGRGLADATASTSAVSSGAGPAGTAPIQQQQQQQQQQTVAPGGGGSGGGGSPATDALWDLKRRDELASMVARTLSLRRSSFGPRLGLLLRYLLPLHSAWRTLPGGGGGGGGSSFRRGGGGAAGGGSGPAGCGGEAAAALVAQVLSEEREGALPPPEHGRPHFPETDVQALAQAIGYRGGQVIRQDAVNLLRLTDGELAPALRLGLLGVRLQTDALDELLREYAAARQLPVAVAAPAPPLPPAPCARQGTQSGAAGAGDGQEAAPAGGGAAASAGVADAADGGRSGMPTQVQGGVGSIAGASAEAKEEGGGGGGAGGGEGGIILGGGAVLLQHPPGSRVAVVRAVCERMRERDYDGAWRHVEAALGNDPCAAPPTDAAAGGAAPPANCAPRAEAAPSTEVDANASAGTGVANASTRTDDANASSAAAADALRTLEFQLRRVQFLRLAADGQRVQALEVARAKLGPAAARRPDLMRVLKQLTSALITAPPPAAAPGGKHGGGNGSGANGGGNGGLIASPSSSPSPEAEAAQAEFRAALVAALFEKLGPQETRLVALLRACLQAHRSWFRRQRCEDRFAAELGVSHLVARPAGAGGGPALAGGAPSGGGAREQTAAAADERGGGRPAAAAAAAAAWAAASAAEVAAPGGEAMDIDFHYQAAAGGASDMGDGAAGGPGVAAAERDTDEEAGGAGPLGRWDDDEDDDQEHDMDSEGEEEDEDGGGGVIAEDLPEGNILMVMEFSGLPRGSAIELLVANDGDPTAVLQSLFP